MKNKFDGLIKKLSKKYRIKELKKGSEVEREHDDVTHGDPETVMKIAVAHLKELPDYYSRLDKMEKD